MAVASNGSKEDGGPLEPYTLDLLGLVPDRSLPLSLSLSSRAIGRGKEREGRRPWEARAICIPNDRMTFARCIKMPLIDGAREKRSSVWCRRCCSIKRSRPPLLSADHLEDVNSLTEGTKRGGTERKEPRPRVKFGQILRLTRFSSENFHFQLILRQSKGHRTLIPLILSCFRINFDDRLKNWIPFLLKILSPLEDLS